MPYDEVRGLQRTGYTQWDLVIHGNGALLADLNVPIPQPDPEWLGAVLDDREIDCEFPDCDAVAATMITLPGRKHSPFVCRGHSVLATRDPLIARTLMKAMVDRILLTSFGKIALPRRRVRRVQSNASFERPQLGQI